MTWKNGQSSIFTIVAVFFKVSSLQVGWSIHATWLVLTWVNLNVASACPLRLHPPSTHPTPLLSLALLPKVTTKHPILFVTFLSFSCIKMSTN